MKTVMLLIKNKQKQKQNKKQKKQKNKNFFVYIEQFFEKRKEKK